MSKSARRKDSEQRSIELDLKMEEKLMELEEDYDDLWNYARRVVTYFDDWTGEVYGDAELMRFKSDRIT